MSWVGLETMLQDLRYGARMVRKNPGFSAVATVTLALGIAVNSSVFSVISGWLLQKPAVADPDRVLAVVATNKARAIDRGRISAADFLEWRRESQSFANLAAADPYHDFSLTGEGEPERVNGMRVTANYFETLGASAMLGRTFAPGEDEPGRDREVLLTYGLWQARFGGDAQIVGKTIALDGEKYAVIGVMPASFRQVAFLPRLWTPLVLPREPAGTQRGQRSLVLFARLKSGVGIEQARAEMAALARRGGERDPATEKGWGADVMTMQEYGIQEDQVRAGLQLLMAAVVLVLAIACANIANLLLARAAKRRQEIAIRTALGAGRARVIRQLLVESLIIACLGGCAGLVGANWGIRILRSALGFNDYLRAMSGAITLDRRVLIFTCLVSLGAALVFGLAPAVRVSAVDPQSALRKGSRTGDPRRGWGRNLLVGSQIALAVVLVTGAGLIIKATAEDLGGDYGYDPKHVLTAAISLTSARYREPARQAAFFHGVLEKLRSAPGVEAAGAANAVPFTAEQRAFSIQGRPALPVAQRPRTRYFAVSAGQFDVLGLKLMEGRAIAESDSAATHRVAVVNRVFAARFFPGESPLGRYIRVDHDAPAWSEIGWSQIGWSEIVGIVGNIKVSYRPKEEEAQVYEPYLQSPMDPEMWIAVRTAGDANTVARALRSAVWAVDRDQPVGSLATIARLIDQQQGGDYVFDALLGIFGALALVMAAVGIYGVVAYAVAQRTHEIGICMALGAHRADILRAVIGKGMLLGVMSIAIGLAAAAPLPRLFRAMLQGYRVHSTPIFLIVPWGLLLVVLAAIYVPAARAARVDPMEALRYE